MKIKTCLLFCLFGNIITAQDPTFTISSDCPNYNSFVDDPMLFTNSHLIQPYILGTLYTDLVKKDSLDAILSTFGLDEDISFQLQFSEDEYNDNSRYYSRFQEYYKGLLVEGGGITVNYIRNKSGDPSNPCDILYSLAPRILTGFSLNTNPTISLSSAIESITSDTIFNSELIITHNLDSRCEFKLVWRIDYLDNVNKRDYIDAHSGQVLLSHISGEFLKANTINYGEQELYNYKVDNENLNYLESDNRRLKIVDFDSPIAGNSARIEGWQNAAPNIITTGEYWGSTTTGLAYQALYIGKKVLTEIDNLGIGSYFGSVSIGTKVSFNNSQAIEFEGFPLVRYILLGANTGNIGGVSALPDVIAHELCHIYLRQFLSSDKRGSSSLHEGICDIFGTFIESKIQGYIDWEFSDDDMIAKNVSDRDLSRPKSNIDCYTEVEKEEKEHIRGVPLGYWFYLISNGKTSPTIPGLGIDLAIKIVLSSLKNLNDDSDYKDLMMSTLSYVLEKYGRCSNEFKAVSQAWELICVPTGSADNYGIIPDCSLGICANSIIPICEEYDEFEFCVCGPGPLNAIYNWTIIGPKSTEYSSAIGMQGNSQNGGQCLTITDIPKYPFYPQYLKLRLHSPTMCNLGIKPCFIEHIIKLNDCGDNDPHCDYPYNETIINTSKRNDFYQYNSQLSQLLNKSPRVKIFDILGRQIFDSFNDEIDINQIEYSGWCFIVYLNEKGVLTKTFKKYKH